MASSQSRAFQPEIQGLRALSVLAVIWTHAHLPGLPGGFTGVDVFFVISGFLITRLLLSELERNGRIDLLAFWARRARRLLPNAYAALIGTLLLALFFFRGYPSNQLVDEILYAAAEIVNFRFAEQAVDYFQAESAASPVLHYWSLAVEEQFYIVWPLLLTGVCFLWQTRRLSRIVLVLAIIWCASFAASFALTFINEPVAYFHTGTRCWQLATGALVAAGWGSIERLPAALRSAGAWVGLAAILLGMAVIDEGGARYPGAWALLPTLGTAALLAGFEATPAGGLLRRAFSAPLMQWIGERSYSWYLWHWPLLALPRATFPGSPYVEVLALPASLAIAALAYSWIEQPLRHSVRLTSAPLATLAGAAAAIGLIAIAGQAYQPALHLLDPQIAVRAAEIEAASRDHSRASQDGCFLGNAKVKQPLCLYGDKNGHRRAVLFGDSHADHWSTALHAAAERSGWQLLIWTKASCHVAEVTPFNDKQAFNTCVEWREDIMRRLTGPDRPDLVVLASYINRKNPNVFDPAKGKSHTSDRSAQLWREGFRKTLERLVAAGVKVVVIRDNPRADKDYKTCLLTSQSCSNPRGKALTDPPMDVEVAREFGDQVKIVDLTDTMCNARTCPATRDAMIVYRDFHHLTARFAASLAPQMTEMFGGVAAELERAAVTPASQHADGAALASARAALAKE